MILATDLKGTLDRLYAQFNYPDSATDPIQIVRRFERPDDREVVGFCAAALAFGRVTSVIQSIERVVAVMGSHPADFVRRFDPKRDRAPFEDFVHRWTRGADVVALLWLLRQMYDRSGSVEAFFVEGYDRGQEDVGHAIDSFSTRALDLDLRSVYSRSGLARGRTRGVGFFFPRPSGGSACKRLNLFLRWMVRHDALDLGVWSKVSSASLVVPLDTHVIRVGRCLRLTRRTSPGWPMARDITASLRAIDPVDPVRYDFALCHLGMMSACGFSRAARFAVSAAWPLPATRARPRSRRPSARP